MTTGLVIDERYFWFDAGRQIGEWVEPLDHGESGQTKRRLANLIDRSGLGASLVRIAPRPAEVAELERVHDRDYIARMLAQNATGGRADDDFSGFAPGDVDIARLAAGGALAGLDELAAGRVDNVYALIRPPGHHATASMSMGYCLFNNVALVARAAQVVHGMGRVAIVDWDVHHGNGAQELFWDDPTVLTISIHQDQLYPAGGSVDQLGGDGALGACRNIPMPAGSGAAAYLDAYDRVIGPALRAFAPDLILVASGYDASGLDPYASMQLSANAYRTLTERVLADAADLCQGRVLVTHEGGYSPVYVPFCGLAVLEALTGIRTPVVDPYTEEMDRRPDQERATPAQRAAVDAAREAGQRADDGNRTRAISLGS